MKALATVIFGTVRTMIDMLTYLKLVTAATTVVSDDSGMKHIPQRPLLGFVS